MNRKRLRELVYQKYDGHCAYCGRKLVMKDMQVDHIVSRYNAGTDDLDNLNPSCRMCNFRKQTYTIEQFREEIQDQANYDDFILNKSHLDDRLKERIRRSHMSLRNCLKVAKRVDLHCTREILLIHLSDGNSDDRKFVREMRKTTHKRVYAAHAGLMLEYNEKPTF
jgi:hypothetical protein